MVCMTMSKAIEPGRIKIVLDLVFKTPQLCGTKARHHHDYEENQCAMYTQPFVWPPRQPQIYLSIFDAPWVPWEYFETYRLEYSAKLVSPIGRWY